MKRLSPAMLKALKAMYEDPEKRAHVNIYTVDALVDRGLAHSEKPANLSKAAGRFPVRMAQLTEEGIAFCAKRQS